MQGRDSLGGSGDVSFEAREPLPWLEGNVSIVVRVRRGVPRHCFSRRSRGWGSGRCAGFQHLVAAAVLCCHAQRVQNLCFDGGEHDGEFGWGVADDDRAFHRSCTLFVLGQEDADRRVVAYHFGIAATDHGGACRGDDLVDAAGRAVGDGIDDRTCFGCAIADDFGFFSWLRRS